MKKINKKIILSFGLLLLLFPIVSFAFADKTEFQFFKEIKNFQEGKINVLDVDHDIESHSKKYLSDIRIFNGSKEEKYVIRKENDKYINSSKDIKLKIISQKQNSFIIDLGNDKKEDYLNKISINTSSVDFRRVVDVYGADIQNGPYFNLNIEKQRGGLIYSLPTGQNKNIEFKYSNYKYLKLIFSGDEGEFKVDSFNRVQKKMETIQGEKDILDVNGFVDMLTGNDQKIIFDTKRNNLFFDQIKIKFSNKRFSRRYILYAADSQNAEILKEGKRFDKDKDYWVKISSGSFNKESYIGNPVIELKNNKRFYRLDIFNGDNEPLDFTAASFEKFKRKIYFNLKNHVSDLKIYYSSDSVRKPNYDFSLSQKQMEMAQKVFLAKEKKNKIFVERNKSIFDDNKWLIYLLIGIIVLILGFFVFKILKESSDKIDKDGVQI